MRKFSLVLLALCFSVPALAAEVGASSSRQGDGGRAGARLNGAASARGIFRSTSDLYLRRRRPTPPRAGKGRRRIQMNIC